MVKDEFCYFIFFSIAIKVKPENSWTTSCKILLHRSLTLTPYCVFFTPSHSPMTKGNNYCFILTVSH